MQRLIKTPILLLGLSVAAGSATVPNDCAGWREIQIDADTLDYLSAHDEKTLKALIGHAETGQARGCW